MFVSLLKKVVTFRKHLFLTPFALFQILLNVVSFSNVTSSSCMFKTSSGIPVTILEVKGLFCIFNLCVKISDQIMSQEEGIKIMTN